MIPVAGTRPSFSEPTVRNIRRPHQCAQCPEGLGQGGAGDTREHVVAQHVVRESGIEERRAGVRQREGKRIEILKDTGRN